MARYPYRRKNILRRRLIYSIGLIVIVLGVLAYIFDFYPFRGEKGTSTLSVESPKEQIQPPKGETERTLTKMIDTDSEPNLEPNPQAGRMVEKALNILSEEPPPTIEARGMLNNALPMIINERQRAFVKDKLAELANEWLFSRTIYPQDKLTGTYKVEQGEQLRIIARQFNVPYQTLMLVNNIYNPQNLKAGQTLKVVFGPFNAIVDRSDFRMDLYLQDSFVQSFPVGLGKEGMETPTGLWVVSQGGKMIKPSWTDPLTGRRYEPDDPDYPLGSRWIGLKGIEGDALGRTGFAIHGTKDPNEIGTATSQGCIRLHNGDAIRVYNLLKEGVSKVRVKE